jgi:hypothetical protein
MTANSSHGSSVWDSHTKIESRSAAKSGRVRGHFSPQTLINPRINSLLEQVQAEYALDAGRKHQIMTELNTLDDQATLPAALREQSKT